MSLVGGPHTAIVSLPSIYLSIISANTISMAANLHFVLRLYKIAGVVGVVGVVVILMMILNLMSMSIKNSRSCMESMMRVILNQESDPKCMTIQCK